MPGRHMALDPAKIDVLNIKIKDSELTCEALMISAGQMRAARALLGIDQRKLADLSGLSLPTIQRMRRVTAPSAATSTRW